MGGHSHQSEGEHDKHAGYGWLAFCVIGMMSSLTLYGLVMEYVTSGGRKLHELSFVFVTTSIYSITAYVARSLSGEKPTNISKYQMLTLSLTSITSTFTSVRSLRYVIYPVQVLFKSCKPVPVMVFNIILGRRYPLKKYVNVIIITTGVALFMGGGKSSKATSNDTSSDTMLLGVMMLSISLIADGVTGAYEDKLMSKEHVEPFDLMYNIQFGKAVISFCCLVATNGLNDFLTTIHTGGIPLLVLGFTGAIGQVRWHLFLTVLFSSLFLSFLLVLFLSFLGVHFYHHFQVRCVKLRFNWTLS
jgi:UDP-galactose transporter B1